VRAVAGGEYGSNGDEAVIVVDRKPVVAAVVRDWNGEQYLELGEGKSRVVVPVRVLRTLVVSAEKRAALDALVSGLPRGSAKR
jgi:hypothetical protein